MRVLFGALTIFRKYVLPSGLFGIYLIVVLLLTFSCSPINPPTLDELAKQRLNRLSEIFAMESDPRFMNHVHPEFGDQAGFNLKLHRDLRSVFRTYNDIDLEFSNVKAQRENKIVRVETSWELRWQCTSINSEKGCPDVEPKDGHPDVVYRRGKSELSFKVTKAGWKLIEQKGNRIFGSRTPGRIQ